MAGITNLLGLGLKSVLEDAVSKAPKVLPAEQVGPYLRGAGVTEDEMKFSGVGVKLPVSGKVTKEDLQKHVTNREDMHGVAVREGEEADYSKVNLSIPGRSGVNPSYREDVYTFKQASEDHALTSSEHFPGLGNYIGHVRRQDDYVDGQRVRTLLELQSDTVAAMRTVKDSKGYIVKPGSIVIARNALDKPDLFAILNDDSGELLANTLGISSNRAAKTLSILKEVYAKHGKEEALNQLKADMIHGSSLVADQPYKKNMYRKLLERQIAQAQEDGITKITVPMEGEPVSGLARGGNQKLYNPDGAIPSEMRKLAKQHGWEYKEEVQSFPISAKAASEKVQHTIDRAANVYGMRPKDFTVSVGETFTALTSKVANKADLSNIVPSLPSVIDDLIGESGANADMSSKAFIKVPDTVKDAAFELQHFISSTLTSSNIQTSVDVPDTVQVAAATVKKWFYGIQGELEKGPTVSHATITMTDAVTGAIKPPKNGFSLYSSPAAGAFAAYAIIEAGADEKTARKRLQEEGYDKEDIDGYMSDAKVIEQGYAAGITEEQIRKFLDKDQVEVDTEEKKNPLPVTTKGSYYHQSEDDVVTDPRLPTKQEQFAKEGTNLVANQRRNAALWGKQNLAKEETLTASELAMSLRALYPDTTGPVTLLKALGGSEEAQRTVYENADNAQRQIIQAFADRGLTVSYSEDAGGYVDEQGKPIDEGFWGNMLQDINNMPFSLAGGISAGIVGFKQGGQIGSKISPVAGVIGAIVGAAAAGAVGSSAGGQLDYLQNAVHISEQLNGQVMVRKALNDAKWSAAGDAAGAALMSVAKLSVQSAKRVIQYLNAKDVPGAMQSTQEFLHLSEDDMVEIRQGYQRIVDVPGQSTEEKALVAAVTTQPGGEHIVQKVAEAKPSVGSAVVKSVNLRAQSLLKATSDMRDANGAKHVVQDLNNYRLDVQRNFEEVKNRAATSTVAGKYRFNFPETAILPIVERMYGKIYDPIVKEKLFNKMTDIRNLTTSRTFTDLLELRKIVNSIANNSSVRNTTGFEDVKAVLASIDKEIDTGAAKAVDNPVQWLKDYREANRLYSEMKSLEGNVLYKALTKQGITPKDVAKALYKQATAIDGTFVEVMSKLPKQTRLSTEAEIFDIMANKFTKGTEGGIRAVNFPELARELRQVPFTSPEARKLQIAILKMADVFKNDVQLAKVNGKIAVPSFQSFLTADPLARMKYAIATKVFRKVKELNPGEMQRNLALVNILTDVLNKPMNAKLLNDLTREAGDRVDISEELKLLSQNAAKQAADNADKGAPRVAVFGEGKVVATKPVVGSMTKGESIPMHRIASTEDARVLAAASGVNPANIKEMDRLLTSHGYQAVQLGTNKIRRLDK